MRRALLEKQAIIDRQRYGTQPDDKMKIVLIGDSHVGKTSLMNRYVENKFDDYFFSTLGVDCMVNNEKLSDDTIMEIEIWDTAGF